MATLPFVIPIVFEVVVDNLLVEPPRVDIVLMITPVFALHVEDRSTQANEVPRPRGSPLAHRSMRRVRVLPEWKRRVGLHARGPMRETSTLNLKVSS
jgi:hypothetical protein